MAKNAVKKKIDYDASSITWLKGLDGVRKKPSMYIGDAGNHGVKHLGFEMVGNALDEVTNGHGDTVGVKIAGDTIAVFDNGRGIPTGPHPEHKGHDVLTILATQLHSGGKLDEKDGNYDNSIGTHGVGLAVVNALSVKLSIWSIRGKTVKKQTFAKGKETSKVVTVKSSDVPKLNGKTWAPKTGTVVEWTWDKSVFDKGTEFKAAEFVQWIKDISWFTAHITAKKRTPVKFIVENGKKVVEFQRKSLKNFVDLKLKELNTDRRDPLTTMDETFMEGYDANHDFLGVWSSSPDFLLHSAVNAVPTSEGGTHLEGAMKAMESAFKKIAKKKQKFRQQDLLAGFIGCFNLRIPSPRFDSQAKSKLTSPNASKIAFDAVEKTVTTWIKKNKQAANQILDRACALHDISNDTKLQKQLASALATKKGGKSLLPPSLIQSTTKNAMERELYLLEGQSAGGTAKEASNRTYQEVLPLRGKMLNVEKASTEKMGANQVIVNLLRSIGYDPKNPQAPLRVGRIMVLSDPDPDGPLDPSTMIPYIEDGTGVLKIARIDFLAKLYQAVEKPLVVLAMTPQGKIQQAKAEAVTIREYMNERYAITFNNGQTLYCTPSHKWNVGTVTNTKKIITAPVTGMTYLAMPDIVVGDQIRSTNQAGFMTVTSITLESTGDYREYYCMTVPQFGNFLVSTTGQLNNADYVVSSNCHINSLLLTVLFKTVPYLFQEGRVFLVNAPLFTYSTPKRKYYGSSLADLVKQVGVSHSDQLKKQYITRIKGYGEMMADDLRDIAFNPETRELIRINHPGTNMSVVRDIMGNSPEYRKQLLGV